MPRRDGVGVAGRSPERADPNAVAWRDRVEELLLAGERIRERVTAGEHGLVVTSHRVLAFHPPSADGPRFRAVDRPNAVAVRTETRESLRSLGWAVALATVGTLVAFVGVSVDFAGLLPTVEATGPMAGSVGGTLATLSTVLVALGRLVVLVGLVTILAGLVAFGRYLRGRRERLVVAVSGAADLSVPPPDEPERAVDALARAIERPPAPDGDDRAVTDDALR
ncbi:hypothetical protein [Halovivax cerinus]|uniref:Uncharacterized protein n=1 Tax=Halovivax cerinus TaxID=1487865 RepID=A0ABD5NR48_9EURY|nr:hypothetical protein [Halovivax cerinus]